MSKPVSLGDHSTGESAQGAVGPSPEPPLPDEEYESSEDRFEQWRSYPYADT